VVKDRPNIILIMPDQHRADALGCAGNPAVLSPNIDRLASEGVLFTQAYAQSPLCQPARASLITGRYPHDHGCVINGDTFPAPEEPNFLNALRDGGYEVAEVGKVHVGVIPPDTPRWPYLGQYGFTYMDEIYGKMAYLIRDSEYTELLDRAGVLEAFRDDLRRRVAKSADDPRSTGWLTAAEVEDVDELEPWFAGPAPVPDELYIDHYVGDRTVEWLEQCEGDDPFFLWVGFCGPHDPYDAPQSYADPYLERLEEIPVGSLEPPGPTPCEAYNSLLESKKDYSGTGEMSAEIVRRLRAFYYGNVTLIDERIGDILRVLEKRDLLDSTWIIFTSDHGDMLGDHQLLAKSVMNDGALRVPMIVRPPGGMEGRVVDDLVELGDAGATILAAAGLEPLTSSVARTLTPYVTLSEGPAREAIFAEVEGFSSVITPDYKYVIERDTEVPCLLFDRRGDPEENRNLADGHDELRQRLYEALLEPFLRS